MQLSPIRRTGPLFEPAGYLDAKDPCIVFDGDIWHIFGSRGSIVDERWQLLHATAPSLDSPWTEDPEPLVLLGMTGERIAAPGVVYEDGVFHMFVHSDFLTARSSVEHLTSEDGRTFTRRDTVVRAEPLSDEAGIYDPHPAEITGRKYVVYSATPGILAGTSGRFRPQPDIYLVESLDSWNGPWMRCGRILDQEELPHHNRKSDPAYEWGIEGPQLVPLPDGRVLLNATCFLPGPRMGVRQRVFFAVADTPRGPFRTLGPVLDTAGADEWECGENGHASAIVIGDELHLFYQGRHARDAQDHRNNRWRHGHAVFALDDIRRAADAA